MPNTPRKSAANDGTMEETKNSERKKSPSPAKSATRSKVKINSRVVFAPGGQGGHKMVKQETGFASMFKKSKPVPAAPTIGVAKSHIYGGEENKGGGAASKTAGDSESMKEWVPDKRNDPYGYWRVVKQASAKQSKAKSLHDAVERVIDSVIHNIHAKPYLPPEYEKKQAPKFDLVSVDELQLICNAARVVCLKEDTLMNVTPPCKVFGDIHGQISDLIQFFRQYGAPSHRIGDINICKYIFIGDFVDRGAYSLEVLLVLLCLKLRYHPHVIMLRGNHEEKMMNQQFGFMEEIANRLGNTMGSKIYDDEIFPLFQALPLAATIDEKILCVHGGPGVHVETLEQIRKIKRPLTKPTFQMMPGKSEQNAIVDLMWADPTNVVGLSKDQLKFNSTMEHMGRCPWSGDSFNYERAVGTRYGPDIIQSFCKRNNLDLIIRAHECVDRGWQVYAEGKGITLFSAPKYGGSEDAVNSGAILEISRDLHIQCKAISAGDTRSVWSNTKDLDRGKRGSFSLG